MENQVAAGAEVTATDAAVVSAEIPQKKEKADQPTEVAG